MYQVSKMLIRKNRYPELWEYLYNNAILAKNLRNAALFRIRNHFTAHGKDSLTDFEQQVEQEIAVMQKTYPGDVGSVLSYYKLEKLMRATKNPDFFAGLPAQTAQHVVREATDDFKFWLNALKVYRADSSKFSGKPKMPGYTKGNIHEYTFTNQNAILYPTVDGFELKLPKTDIHVPMPQIPKDSNLAEVKVIPYYDDFMLCVTIKVPDAAPSTARGIAAIDFGVDNTAALVSDNGLAILYKGGALKAKNQWYNKETARLNSELMKGHNPKEFKRFASHKMKNISRNRDLFLTDQMHKISKDIINKAIENNIGTIVIGNNKGWKQEINIGHKNNQNFKDIPLGKLKNMITYKAEAVGIKVVLQEENYTSKADFLSGDVIPTYGKEKDTGTHFSGKRIKRGLYCSGTGVTLNADINGAMNILRKAYPESCSTDKDFSYLLSPQTIGFKDLNEKKSKLLKEVLELPERIEAA